MNSYSAYAENVEGIYGAGDILKEVKQSVQDSIDILMTLDKDEIPSVLKDEYELNFVFETQSFLEYYGDIFSRAALSRLTGINERQLGHYIQGVHKPRRDKAKKIEKALHELGEELLSIELE